MAHNTTSPDGPIPADCNPAQDGNALSSQGAGDCILSHDGNRSSKLMALWLTVMVLMNRTSSSFCSNPLLWRPFVL